VLAYLYTLGKETKEKVEQIMILLLLLLVQIIQLSKRLGLRLNTTDFIFKVLYALEIGN
jgi:uncharacterized membrane protein